MNITAPQEKEKNEETRMGKRKAEKERKQATDFKEAACCPSAVVHGAAQQKNEGECPPLGRPTAISTQLRQGWGLHHHVEATVDWRR